MTKHAKDPGRSMVGGGGLGGGGGGARVELHVPGFPASPPEGPPVTPIEHVADAPPGCAVFADRATGALHAGVPGTRALQAFRRTNGDAIKQVAVPTPNQP